MPDQPQPAPAPTGGTTRPDAEPWKGDPAFLFEADGVYSVETISKRTGIPLPSVIRSVEFHELGSVIVADRDATTGRMYRGKAVSAWLKAKGTELRPPAIVRREADGSRSGRSGQGRR